MTSIKGLCLAYKITLFYPSLKATIAFSLLPSSQASPATFEVLFHVATDVHRYRWTDAASCHYWKRPFQVHQMTGYLFRLWPIDEFCTSWTGSLLGEQIQQRVWLTFSLWSPTWVVPTRWISSAHVRATRPSLPDVCGPSSPLVTR